jgi:putative salt-induced outer membrane protein
MPTRRFVGTLAAGFIAGTAFAQTAPKPDGEWRGGIGLSAAAARGNTETTNLGLNADAIRQSTNDKLGFYLQDIFASSKNAAGEKSLSAQIFRIGGKYDRDITDRLYGFGGIDFEHDKLAGVKQRILPQGGVGFHVIKSEPTTFDVFSGIAYNETKSYTDPTTRKAELLLGEESIHKISASTAFRQRLAIYAPFSDLSDKYRIQFDAGLTTAVIGGWNLVVNYTFRHNNAPPAGRKKDDSLLFTGLQYAWGPK